MSRRTWNESELTRAVSECYSYAAVLREVGLVPAGGNHAQLKKYIKEFKLDTSHFTGSLWSKGKKIGPKPRFPLTELLVKDRLVGSDRLRKRLIREGLFKKKCYKCNRVNWLGKSIPLELEHINGIKTDNRIENLTLLCPNCHAQTDTYRGKNKQGPLAK